MYVRLAAYDAKIENIFEKQANNVRSRKNHFQPRATSGCKTMRCRAFYEGVLPPMVISNGDRGQHPALEALL